MNKREVLLLDTDNIAPCVLFPSSRNGGNKYIVKPLLVPDFKNNNMCKKLDNFHFIYKI